MSWIDRVVGSAERHQQQAHALDCPGCGQRFISSQGHVPEGYVDLHCSECVDRINRRIYWRATGTLDERSPTTPGVER